MTRKKLSSIIYGYVKSPKGIDIMKKLLTLILALILVLSMTACDRDDDGNGDDSDDTTLKMANTNDILALVKGSTPYKAVKFTTHTSVTDVNTGATTGATLRSYIRDENGNVMAEILSESMTPVSVESLIGNEYYAGTSGAECTKAVLSDKEKETAMEALLKKYKDGIFDLNDFDDINVVDNEDGTYTLICNEGSDAKDITEEIAADLETLYPDHESVKVSAVDYQLTVDSKGNTKSFVFNVLVDIKLAKSEETGELVNGLVQDKSSTSAAYFFAAAVEEYTGETLTAPTMDFSSTKDVSFSDIFGK